MLIQYLSALVRIVRTGPKKARTGEGQLAADPQKSASDRRFAFATFAGSARAAEANAAVLEFVDEVDANG